MATGHIPSWTDVDVEAGVYDPASDDTPWGETRDHRHAIIDLIQALADRYAADPRAFVPGALDPAVGTILSTRLEARNDAQRQNREQVDEIARLKSGGSAV